MPSYIVRINGDSKVVGTQMTGEDLSVLPPQFDPAEYLLVSQADYEAINNVGLRHRPGPGDLIWTWNGSSFVQGADTRYILDISFSKLTVAIAQDSVGIDLTLLNPDQTPTNFNGAGRMLVSMGDGRPNLYRIQFTNGVRNVAQFKPTIPGTWTIEPTAQYVPQGDTELEVVEDL